jgi:PAS domain S-box-containing protein
VAQSPISIVIASRAAIVEYANPRFYELTGRSPEATIGQPCGVITGALLPDPARREVQRAVAAGEPWRGEVAWPRPRGALHARILLTPVRNPAGEIATWLYTMEDATHERALEQQLVQAQKMEALGTLAGGIAHDFNNVLSPIIGYTELARAHAADDAELSEDLAQVSEAAFRARDLVRQILTFSRKAEKKKVPLRVSSVAQEALKLLRPSIPATIEIRQRFEGDGLVLADPTQVHQVIMNLCTNAFHAMEQSGGVLAVSVEEQDVVGEKAGGVELVPGRYAVLSVSDTGIGMDRETLGRIFDPYFTTKEKGKGTGLGLAVVDGIVRDHEGRVAVYSEPGAGTTFRVYLPLTAQRAPGLHAGSPQRLPVSGAGHERVLVVDDEESIRSIVGRSLGAAGYRLALFAAAGEALETLSRDPHGWDLLITDMTMPGMNGKELARRAMELRPDLPVILCCGYSSLISAEEARRMGIRTYLEKPMVMSALLETVRRVLDERSGRGNPAA